MSVRQAQEIAARLQSISVPWNAPFGGGPATMLAGTELPGGMRVTLLSPAAGDFSRFVDSWQAELARGPAPSQASVPRVEPDAPQADAATLDRPVLYFANAPEDDRWRNGLVEAIGAPIADVDLLFGDFSVPDAWQRLDRADRERPRVAVVLVSNAALESTFAREQIDFLVGAVGSHRFRLATILVGPCNWASTPLASVPPMNDVALSSQRPSVASRELARLAKLLAASIREASYPDVPSSSVRGEPHAGDTPVDVERLAGTPFRGDRSVANNASLALLLEQHGKAILVGGDASARTLAESVKVVLNQRKARRLQLDVFVVPHNGSAANLDRDLLQLLDCDRYLIASNGATFRHPDRETIARILAYGRNSPETLLTLVFNYRTPQTLIWDDPELQQRWNYRAVYPPQDGAGVAVHL